MLPLIQIKNLTVEFPGTESSLPALQDFSLELNRGEMLAVVGESGSGKSVMSLSIMNLLSKNASVKTGSILFSPDGLEAVEMIGMPEKQYRSYRGNDMAMIFQEPMSSLNPVMTCGAQVSEPMMIHKKLSRSEAKAASLLLFEKVQLPDPTAIFNKYPHQLSGGQKQRVMIAMAISCQPSLLICDEPTTALDVRVQQTILELLKNLRVSENMGMIFITHDLGLVADLADRAMVMLRGRVVESGPVGRLFNHPVHPYTKGLLMCRPALHVKGERLPVVSDFLENAKSEKAGMLPSEPIQPKLVQDETRLGQTKSKLTQVDLKSEKADTIAMGVPDKGLSPGTPSGQEILLKVRGLHLAYSSGKSWLGREKPGYKAIEDINFDVYRGETLGLVGESGSGKTTLGRALLGLSKPSSGSIQYGDVELLTMSRKEVRDFRRNIQIVFQDPYSSLNPRLMVGPAIAEPIQVHGKTGRTESTEKVLALLKRVDLKKEHFNRYPHEFSGGQRQRIVIARALALNPGFVVFDESVSALDVSVQAQVLNLINDLKENFGFTAIFISHDLSVIRYLCDRVIIMEKGKVVESGDVDKIYQHPQTDYTRSLIEAIPGGALKGFFY